MAIDNHQAINTNLDCNCICKLCDCHHKVAELQQQQLLQAQASNKDLEAKYGNLQSKFQQLKKDYQQLIDTQDYDTGPHTPPSKQPLGKKIKGSKSKTDTKEVEETPKPSKPKGRKVGHIGTTKEIEPTDEIHDYVKICCNCHADLDLSNQRGTGAYTEVEIPDPIPVRVTRHYTYEAPCSNCGQISRSVGNLKGTIFGPNAAAFLSDVWYTGVVSLAKVAEIFANLTELEFSASVIDKVVKVAAEAVNDEVTQIKQEVLQDKHPHLDETSYTIIKDTRSLGWIFVIASKEAVFFEFRDSRSGKFLKDFWNDIDEVIPSVDGWQGYNFFEKKGRCWVHLIRESEDLVEISEAAKMVHLELRKLYNDVQATRKTDKIKNSSIQARAKARLTAIISRLEGRSDEKIQKFHRKLLNAQPHMLTVMEYEDLPMENNHAERLLRALVLSRKTRGKVASDKGAQALVTLASFWETCRLRKTNPREELRRLLKERSQME